MLAPVKESKKKKVDGFVSVFDKSKVVGICLQLSRQSRTLSDEKPLSVFVSCLKFASLLIIQLSIICQVTQLEVVATLITFKITTLGDV